MIKTSALPPLKNIEAKNYYSESFFLDSSSIFKFTETGCFLEPKSDHTLPKTPTSVVYLFDIDVRMYKSSIDSFRLAFARFIFISEL